jgi:anhydro-N-acetylmuramic acid kinase
MAVMTAIGLMSGTSYDGIDIALIETNGEEIGRLGPTGYRPYSKQEREQVRHAIAAASNLTNRSERSKILIEVEETVTDMHAEAVEAFLAANGMPPDAVAVVGFHGQTVVHRPERKLSVQLGNGAALSGRLGIPIVYDFRAADIAAGGQGAPMVPIFHRAMVRLLRRSQRSADHLSGHDRSCASARGRGVGTVISAGGPAPASAATEAGLGVAGKRR